MFDPDIGKATRWKKGQASPNPGGRPRSRLLSEALRTRLAEVKPDDTQNGRGPRSSRRISSRSPVRKDRAQCTRRVKSLIASKVALDSPSSSPTSRLTFATDPMKN